MAPQSRGPSPERPRAPFSPAGRLPPTLRPFLDNLPSPTALIPDQRTPTGPRFPTPDRDALTPRPSPARGKSSARFQLGDDEDNSADGVATEREDGHVDDEDEVAGVTLDDDDFEQHYSRNESEEDSEYDEEDDGEEDGDEADHENDNDDDDDGGGGGEHGRHRGAAGNTLSRVHSLPTQPPPPPVRRPSLHTSQSATSLPPVPPAPLYPPFYNRPPTPLPPSPSLTSLLRPPSLLARSATSTRPTTPDSSDVETPNDTEAAVAHSARRATPLPPTSPKVPTYEYYGFVLYLASSLTFLMYILWSYLPSTILHALGITYYPNRWWSLAIPAWIVVLLIFIYVALTSYNVEYLTLPMNSLECMVDDAANVAILENGRVRKGGSKKLVHDIEEHMRREKERERMDKGKKKYGSVGKKKKRHGKGGTASKENLRSPEAEFFMAGPVSPGQGSTFPYPATYPFLPHDGRSAPVGQHGWEGGMNWKMVWNEGTDAVMDVPIGGVCEVLYGE